MQEANVTEETLVRRMPNNIFVKLACFCDIDNLWEQLASKITANPDDIFRSSEGNVKLRYTMTHILHLAKIGHRHGGSSTMALLKDWGQQNCKIKHLVEALYQANINLAAMYIQEEVLHVEPRRGRSSQQDSTTTTPANQLHNNTSSNNSSISDNNSHSISRGGADKETAEVMVLPVQDLTGDQPVRSDNVMDRSSAPSSGSVMNNQLGCFSGIEKTEALESAPPPTSSLMEELHTMELNGLNDLKEIQFNILQAVTNNFDKRPYENGGNLIGEGGFGTVFIANFSPEYKVAVKCLKENNEDSLQQFKIELETLLKFKHANLVLLLGYSASKNSPRCLIYQYLPNGSLEERLACRHGTPALSVTIRLQILEGTARGIAFLHDGGLVHRDIKTANILLDADFNPKVGDFATAKLLPKEMTATFMKASIIIGTVPYLAPEAMSFVIHPSLDSFSFGVVILEILTGLPVTDSNREESDLKIHVQEHCCAGDDDEVAGTIFDLLDSKGEHWNKDIVDSLYSMSCHCLEHSRKKRPAMAVILSELERLCVINEVEEVH